MKYSRLTVLAAILVVWGTILLLDVYSVQKNIEEGIATQTAVVREHSFDCMNVRYWVGGDESHTIKYGERASPIPEIPSVEVTFGDENGGMSLLINGAVIQSGELSHNASQHILFYLVNDNYETYEVSTRAMLCGDGSTVVYTTIMYPYVAR